MKLTPIDLSKEPVRIAVGAQSYDFASQRRTMVNSQLTVTHGGTQTFSEQGKPKDRDND